MKIGHLEGWMSFKDAARLLGMSRQGFHKMVMKENQHLFHTEDVKYLGDKALFVVKTEAMERVIAMRERAKQEKMLLNDTTKSETEFKLTQNN